MKRGSRKAVGLDTLVMVVVTEESFRREILDRNGWVLLNFWTGWSAECRTMRAVIRDLVDSLRGEISFAATDWDQEKELAKRLKVVGVPTGIFFLGGREVHRFLGIVKTEELRSRIAEIQERVTGDGKGPLRGA